MNRFMLVAMVLLSLSATGHAMQRGGRGGAFSPGGQGRPAVQPAARPNMQVTRPQPPAGRPQMPAQRPQVNVGGMSGVTRPMPQVNPRPSLPSTPSRPVTPVTGRPSLGMTPGATVRPGIPTMPPTSTRPITPPASTRPPITTLPGVTRPTPVNPWVRPGTAQSGTGVPTTRPITKPGPTRPGSGVDLGLDRPVRPTPPHVPPIGGGASGIATRPITPPTTRPITPPTTRPIAPPTSRPIAGQRPVVRPPTTRPVINNPVVVHNNQVNRIINTRPNWVQINNTKVNNIHHNWNNVIVNRPTMHNWVNTHPQRYRYWNNWGNGIRYNWRYYHHHRNWFGPTWWSTYRPAFGGWHYYYWVPYYPYNYWWGVPTWARLQAWFNWRNAVLGIWQQPIYYDYGLGGNVIYQNNMVYIGGQQVSTVSDFAQSAAVLATVPPPATEEQAAAAEWMPLGTFALSTGEKDTEPTRVVQLAVNKDGIISGTLFNYQTDDAVSVQGQVDKETQRVAIRLGERDNLVAETGMYNLTQNEVPVLVHFGTERSENFLFVRLQNEDGTSK